MSTMKLLQRVVSPEVYLPSVSRNKKKVAEAVASNLHFSSYGITSDPLTQFAIVFAALVHDVDHGGVSNSQLVAECDPLALKFDDGSPAEQHSVCVAWEVIMRPAYEDLRAILFATDEDQNRFRQLLVNSVMATDIFDPELRKMREMRWSKAFASDEVSNEYFNRKATIVIEQYVHSFTNIFRWRSTTSFCMPNLLMSFSFPLLLLALFKRLTFHIQCSTGTFTR
jgi:hypothetical protein